MTDQATAAPVVDAGASASVSDYTPATDPSEAITTEQAFAAYKTRRDTPAESAAPATAETELAVEANAAPAEEPAPSEAPPEADPAEEPPIERPRSWTKDVDDVWQSLPRPLQEKVAAREQERERELRRSQNEAAERLKGLTAKEQEAERARQQYEAQLPALMQTLQDAQNGAFADIRTVDDVTKLANEDPFRYLQWQAHQTKLQAVDAEVKRANDAKAKQLQTDWTTFVQKENELAAEYIPDLADKTKASALMTKASEALQELGFKDEELGRLANGEKVSIFDHRIQRLIFNHLKFTEAKAAPPKAITRPVPQVQRPGVAQPKGQAGAELVQASRNKLTATGDIDDAFALYQARKKASA